MPIISKFEIYGIILVIIALAMGAAYYKGHKAGADEVQQKFDLFTAQVKAEGEKAKADALQKEKDYATQITTATDARNAALSRLQLAQAAANSSRNRVSLTPAPAAGSTKICFEPVAFAAAIERYRQRVAGVVGTGDSAQIDAQTLIQAWPKERQAQSSPH